MEPWEAGGAVLAVDRNVVVVVIVVIVVAVAGAAVSELLQAVTNTGSNATARVSNAWELLNELSFRRFCERLDG